MKFKPTFIIICLLALGLNNAHAQKGNPPPMDEQSYAKATAPSPAALKAAEEMLIASGMDTQFGKNISTMVTQYATQIPEDKRPQFIEVMNKFLNKYISWDVIKHDIFVMYAREFTEAELKQLTAFYRSSIGLKMKEKQPLLIQTGMAIGQQAVASHEDELKQMMTDVMK